MKHDPAQTTSVSARDADTVRHVPWHQALSEPCWCGQHHAPIEASELNRNAELVRAVETAERHLKRADRLETALRGCWDEYHEVMPDDLYEEVKAALEIRVFEATPLERTDG